MESSNNSSIAKIIGNNIKQLRTLNGFSQEMLAEKINRSAHYISIIERGKSGLSLSTVIDICKALNTDTNTIFAGTIDTSNIYTDNFVHNAIDKFNDTDRELVSYIVNYILNSKK